MSQFILTLTALGGKKTIMKVWKKLTLPIPLDCMFAPQNNYYKPRNLAKLACFHNFFTQYSRCHDDLTAIPLCYLILPQCPGQAPTPGKAPMYRILRGHCSTFYTNVWNLIPGKLPCGPKSLQLCLSTHGRLPGTLWYYTWNWWTFSTRTLYNYKNCNID